LANGTGIQLLNALKYSTSFPVIYLSFLLGAGSPSSNLQYYWIAALMTNYALSSMWDLLVDWDLGYASGSSSLPRKQSKSWFLRPQLLFSGSPIFYYVAAFFNCAIRGAWIFRIYLITSDRTTLLSIMDSDVGIFLLQVMEITRRFLWLVIRVEVHSLQSSILHKPFNASNDNVAEDVSV